MPQRIVFVLFDGFEILDLTGPGSVYSAANELLGREAYRVAPVSGRGGTVRSSAGFELACMAAAESPPDQVDALFIVGGGLDAIAAVIEDLPLRDWTRRVAARSARIGSVCSGSAILAAWDLIGERRFATHWSAAAQLRAQWPQLQLDAEAIFVEDGRLWTSAGVTTGIDMTLAIIERDHGGELARQIAQKLVLSIRRPGWQSQFSTALVAQSAKNGRYGQLIAWIAERLDRPLGIEVLAERAGETPRSFHRNFAAATGATPAAFVTRQRVERARSLIGEGLPLKTVARHCGYPDVARLSAAFRKVIGISASEYRVIHVQKGEHSN